jgi:hydrogenase 3 maturation protease
MKFAFMGIGNDLRGDDGVGWYVIDQLQKSLKSEGNLFIKTSVPENHVYDIAKFSPDFLIMIDSTNFRGKPGEIRVIKEEEIKKPFISTHTTPPTIFIKLLKKEIPKVKILFFGIQIKRRDFGKPMTKEVKESGDKLAKSIIKDIVTPNELNF